MFLGGCPCCGKEGPCWRCYGKQQSACCLTDAQGAGYQYAELIESGAIPPGDSSGLTLTTDGKLQLLSMLTRTEDLAGCKAARAEFGVGGVGVSGKGISVNINWLDGSPANWKGPLVYLSFSRTGGNNNGFSYATWITKATFAGKTIIGGEGCAGVSFLPDAKCDLPDLITWPPPTIGNDPQLYNIQDTVPIESFTGLVEVEWLFQQRERDPNIPDSDFVIISEDSGAFSFEWDQVVEMAACLPCGEDPDTPVEYQCFDAPPDEAGWTPVGDCHSDEESCTSECPPTPTSCPEDLTTWCPEISITVTRIPDVIGPDWQPDLVYTPEQVEDREVQLNRAIEEIQEKIDSVADRLTLTVYPNRAILDAQGDLIPAVSLYAIQTRFDDYIDFYPEDEVYFTAFGQTVDCFWEDFNRIPFTTFDATDLPADDNLRFGMGGYKIVSEEEFEQKKDFSPDNKSSLFAWYMTGMPKSYSTIYWRPQELDTTPIPLHGQTSASFTTTGEVQIPGATVDFEPPWSPDFTGTTKYFCGVEITTEVTYKFCGNRTGGRSMTTKPTGPGTNLKHMLAWFNINAKEGGCSCKSLQKRMDKNGPQWCRDNLESVILPHLAKEAKKRKLPFVRVAAEKLVRMAIRKAEKDSA